MYEILECDTKRNYLKWISTLTKEVSLIRKLHCETSDMQPITTLMEWSFHVVHRSYIVTDTVQFTIEICRTYYIYEIIFTLQGLFK